MWAARPFRVVEDTPERLAFWTCEGASMKLPADPDGNRIRQQRDDFTLVDEVWRGNDSLRIAIPGAAHSVLLWWVEGELQGWYVNLETPLRRTSIGFDYLDQKLDLVVRPDGSWRWKDEDELAEAVELGILDRDEAAAVRAEGERVLAAWPFPTGWEEWRPDPEWEAPRLPAGWDRV